LKFLAVACALGAIGCGPPAPAKSAKEMTGEELNAEQQRCKALGLKVYEDKACRAAQQESNDRFLGKSKAPGQ
jgi:conjugative transfer region protein TrbK